MKTSLLVLSLLVSLSESFGFETTADDVQIDIKQGVLILSGNAQAVFNDKKFTADKIVVYKNNDQKLPSKIIATGHVLYSDDKNTISAGKCESNMISVFFSQNVIIQSHELGKIEADKMEYVIETKKIDLTSKKKVKLTLNENVVTKLSKKIKK